MALAYTNLDGLLVKACDYELYWNSRKLAVSKTWQYQQSHTRFLIFKIKLSDILDFKKTEF